MPSPDLKIQAFSTAAEWRAWLDKNYLQQEGLFLQLYKKNSLIPSVTYAEALEEALCYGWIDGIKKSYDEKSYLQKFTPRRPKSVWSKINIEHIERLTKAGKMMPTGLAAVAAAKADGRWQQAYDSPKNMVMPADFMDHLDQNPSAKAFFETLNKQNKYAIAYQLQTAKKPETRIKRLEKFLGMMAAGQQLH